MPKKGKKWGLLLFAGVFGLGLGIYQPIVTQRMLSFVGLIAGLGYFFLFQPSKDKDKKDDDDSKKTIYNYWFFIIRMLLSFIIGGAIGSAIPFMINIYG